jgi:hypothetical protein
MVVMEALLPGIRDLLSHIYMNQVTWVHRDTKKQIAVEVPQLSCILLPFTKVIPVFINRHNLCKD